MAEYPQTGTVTFQQALRTGAGIVSAFFRDFQDNFNMSVPDERGLTDRLLLEMKKAGATVNFTRSSQAEEGQYGYDYSWKFTTANKDTPVPQALKFAIYLQAKSYKPDPTPARGPNAVTADFTYKNANGRQMDLLNNKVAAAKAAAPDIRVFGGYILYSRTTVTFVPLPDVLQAYAASTGVGETAKNRELSDKFLAGNYPLDNIISYK